MPTWRSSTSSLGTLRRLLTVEREELPREIQQNIDMESYRIQQTGSGKVALERKGSALDPVATKETREIPHQKSWRPFRASSPTSTSVSALSWAPSIE